MEIDEGRIAPGRRKARLQAEPTVSVVVASLRDEALLDACLASLTAQSAEYGAELVVARATEPDALRHLQARWPEVRFVSAQVGSTVPELRGLGLAAAGGDIVALTEDHCVVSPHWLSLLVGGWQNGSDVVGGAMDNAQQDRAVDWAAYFSEYGFFAEGTQAPDGSPPLLTGANVAYSRRVIEQVVDLARRGEWENIVHNRLSSQGRTLRFIQTAAVYQNQNYRFWGFCRDRYEHGRDFARRRLAEEGSRRRWLLLPGSTLLPFLLTLRVTRAVGRHHRAPFLRALPITFTFLSAWAVGEAVGYWRGPQAAGMDT